MGPRKDLASILDVLTPSGRGDGDGSRSSGRDTGFPSLLEVGDDDDRRAPVISGREREEGRARARAGLSVSGAAPCGEEEGGEEEWAATAAAMGRGEEPFFFFPDFLYLV